MMEGFAMYKIFIVEDDAVIANQIKKRLEMWDYEVKTASNFRDILTDFADFSPALVLMDITLPFYNGYHWCNEIRKLSAVPIIFISSASDNMNIVMAMNMGGDDFIAKPFDMEVLTAKIQALLRRTYDLLAAPSHLITCGNAILNTSDATLTCDGHRLDLTKNDYRLLQVLMSHKGEAISRDTLIEKLWESDSYIDENTLTVNITRLRHKLEGIGLKDFIKTKKGIGDMVE